MIGSYLEFIRLLGTRTAELHLALAAPVEDPAFAPEPFTDFYRHGLYHGVVARLSRTLDLLGRRLPGLPDTVRAEVERLLQRQSAIRERYRTLRDQRIYAHRIRIHGDYHLGQALYTGRDFVIIDFEGDPARPQSERRIKRSPLRDVAGMLRSFHYATEAALLGLGGSGSVRPEDRRVLEPWARFWQSWSSAAYLNSYLATAAGASFLPDSREELSMLLEVHLLEKAVYELGYELNNRPDWAGVPLQGILQLIEAA